MARLSRRDHESLISFLGRLYAPRDAGSFADWIARELRLLLGGHLGNFARLELLAGEGAFTNSPAPGAMPESEANTRFLRLCREHPCIVNEERTGYIGAVKISDFVSSAQFHRLRLYDEFYREIGVEDQIATSLLPPGPRMLAVSVSRDRRSFSERERLILDLLRPHLARAFFLSERLGRVDRARSTGALETYRQFLVEVSADGRLLDGTPEVRALFERHFGPAPRGGAERLPGPLARWLAGESAADQSGKRLESPRRPLLHRLHGRTLLADRTDCRLTGRRFLLLEESTDPAALAQVAVRGGSASLTHREVEILAQVELGKTNKEIAGALAISPFTVRKHLENAYEKLGIGTRTGAVRRLREILGER